MILQGWCRDGRYAAMEGGLSADADDGDDFLGQAVIEPKDFPDRGAMGEREGIRERGGAGGKEAHKKEEREVG